MASQLARALLGEADRSASPSVDTAGQEWFDSLQDEIKHILLADYGEVDAVELCPLAYLTGDAGTDWKMSDPSTWRTATWAELESDPELIGDWENLTGQRYSKKNVTCYGVYMHQPGQGARHVEDYGTYEEAKLKADAIGAILGIKVHDFTNRDSR